MFLNLQAAAIRHAASLTYTAGGGRYCKEFKLFCFLKMDVEDSVNRGTFSFEKSSLPMNPTACSFARLSLTPALSRWARENCRLMA
jgi:hypothetical protein